MEKLKEVLLSEIEEFRSSGHKFLNGEMTVMDFKHLSGGMGSYAHRGGKEFMLRLRIPSQSFHRKEIQNASVVREMHTYGKHVPINFLSNEFQHKGYGKKLLAEAEKISKEEFDKKKVVVIAGSGVKEYFIKQGYYHDGPYVSKNL